ncbi:MAG: flap endonuclease-1 [Candidatus Undinarchaeales archaeon]|jgi:flap endonuclease-1|nr:flap endonuclease-1 [Candidatus Undinarchaeales archaeon]
MGVQLRDLLAPRELAISDLAGLKVAIDGYNALYQFISSIRQRDGTPLHDVKGNITSHLSGTFYRTANLVEKGVQPVYVFDGPPPLEKRAVLDERRAVREEAKLQWEKALREGRIEDARKYSQQAVFLTKDMVAEAKTLLDHMGIPWVDAPAEGEAQAAQMAAKGTVDAAASQDYDSLLFGAPTFVRNVTLSGRRKLPGRNIYVPVVPERLDLAETLETLGITREQLVLLGVLIGTDYNPGGVKGIGPKKGLKLVKEQGTLERVLENVTWEFDLAPDRIMEMFLEPDADGDVSPTWGRANVPMIVRFMADGHDFSDERIERTAKRMAKNQSSGTQGKLDQWF